MKLIRTIAGAAALTFSAVVTPAFAQTTSSESLPECTPTIMTTALEQRFTAEEISGGLRQTIQAGNASTWNEAAVAMSNFYATHANNQRLCSGQPDISGWIVEYAEVEGTPVPTQAADTTIQTVDPSADAVASPEAARQALPAAEEAVETKESELERVETQMQNPLLASPSRTEERTSLEQQVENLTKELETLRGQRDSLKAAATQDWVSSNYVDNTRFANRFDPNSDDFFMKDEEMVEALRKAIGAVSEERVREIVGEELAEGNTNAGSGTGDAAESNESTWLEIALIALAVFVLGFALVYFFFLRHYMTEDDMSAYARTSDVTDDMKKKADLEAQEKLESRVTAAEERLEDTREQAGSKEVQIPEDTLAKVNALQEGEDDYFFLLADEQPYKIRIRKGSNADELIILSGIKDQGSSKANAVTRKNLKKVMRKAAFNDRLTMKDDGQPDA